MNLPLDEKIIGSGISMIFPVYNEAFILEDTIRNYFDELNGKIPFELILAEDGSTDDTKTVAHRLERTLPIRVYTSDERKGYLKAIKDALKLAQRDWVFLVDSDYQFAAIDFWRLVPYMANYDIILGMKSPRRDPFYRIILSRGLNFILRVLFGVPYRDMDTGFRLMRRETIERIAPQVRHFAFFTAEFVVRAHQARYRVVEVPVPHYSRKEGATNIFFFSKIPKIVLQQLRGIWHLREELRGLKSAGAGPVAPANDRKS